MEAVKGMKIYKLNMCDWWAGPSLGATLAQYQQDTECSDDGLIDEGYPPKELTDDAMDLLVFTTENGGKVSFAEELRRQSELTNFGGQPFPFASTEF